MEQLKSNNSIFGFAGREGAGKSTAAALLANNTSNLKIEYDIYITNNIISYLIDIWFHFENSDKDSIWGLTKIQIEEKLEFIFDKFIGNWRREIYDVPKNFKRKCQDGWYVAGLADLLKLGCAGLFSMNLDVLLGETVESRVKREVDQTQHYSICGAMTGRRCLQYFATEVMRNNFDEGFWSKIIAQKIKIEVSKGNKVIVPDVRFENDLNSIWDLGGTVIMVYKYASDLLLSNVDRTLHPSSWEFLQVLANNKNKKVIYIKNPMEFMKFKKRLVKCLDL